MDKKERYYNFIVDDLIKKTEIDHDQGTIRYPHLKFPYPSPHPQQAVKSSYTSSRFSDLIQGKYGAHDEEVDDIWNIYEQRIQSIINNG